MRKFVFELYHWHFLGHENCIDNRIDKDICISITFAFVIVLQIIRKREERNMLVVMAKKCLVLLRMGFSSGGSSHSP